MISHIRTIVAVREILIVEVVRRPTVELLVLDLLLKLLPQEVVWRLCVDDGLLD